MVLRCEGLARGAGDSLASNVGYLHGGQVVEDSSRFHSIPRVRVWSASQWKGDSARRLNAGDSEAAGGVLIAVDHPTPAAVVLPADAC